LLYLNLRNTRIKDTEAKRFCYALEKNKTLTYLNIEGNNISINVKNKINELIMRNKLPQPKKPSTQLISQQLELSQSTAPKSKIKPKTKRPVVIPNDYKCPISLLIMFDPAMATDGHTYEKESILNWFETGKKISPKTGGPLPSFQVFPNHSLKGAIRQFLDKYPYLWETDEIYESEKLKKQLITAIQTSNIPDIKRYVAQDRRFLWKPIHNNKTLLKLACTQKNPDVLKAVIALLGDLFKAQVGNDGDKHKQIATKFMGNIGGKIIADALEATPKSNIVNMPMQF
jgi:hypothetical protein